VEQAELVETPHPAEQVEEAEMAAFPAVAVVAVE
jgi:hypothetical protein